jgi:hypothetical protein
MSKYSEKHRALAPCAEPHCEEPAIQLALLHGRPVWLCNLHYTEHLHKRSA